MTTETKRLPAFPSQRATGNKQKNAGCVKDTNEKHFAAGFNFYKIFLVFIMGSVIGCLVETIFMFVTQGGYECRASLIYGPFNLIYGIGALVLYVGLYKINRQKKLHIFIFGALAGTIVEYICSWVQEMAFGTISWDYTDLPLNIGGRVCLLFGVFWGLLSLAWVMFIQPAFDKLISKIPNFLGAPATWCLCLFMVFNVTVSAAAVTRWQNRTEGVPATTQVQVLLDRLYPDSLMEHNFGEMVLPGQAV